MKVLNFGSLNIDYVYQVDHMVQAGETLTSEKTDIFLGGKGFNQSVALAKAGVPVYHAGMIGEDGETFLAACTKYGIQTDYIQKVEGRNGHTIIQVDKNAQNCIMLYGGANRKISKTFIDKVLKNFEEGDFLLLQNEISQLDYVIDQAYEKGMQIILNPSPFDHYLDSCDMSKISYFILNEIEGAQISGASDPEEIAKIMLRKYPAAKLVLTLGSDGSMYKDAAQEHHQGICKVNAVDTTAAGDTFTGYFIAGILENMSIPDILYMCATASGIAVSREGASPSIPTMDEVRSKL
ncbi:MAG: ribokinase [Lachnospiraceae bacterium]|nr:ribokinase [Lachnospiraceae bacterium]